ncbi:hypothetical protein GLOTRDRAFT_134807 [Gloeophyllum trabeum ATCC 11539]|uniref:Uncharacterized protein n=1 Tax=Gloeophyllum trabeum (strain ATCC 11539 / FP-39264 / Madison 617) TaxID=670483 RepID=S7S2P6_GLOTA|nr:uncharacterized protein GLOTRDRAFT_134807 [Gloeophyllum trabeum ATCC 11539]EPQ60044.1 hypothetical protein GLOTRDRAFT_134807 [Gloeophyllum trabeum ATCC 11539]
MASILQSLAPRSRMRARQLVLLLVGILDLDKQLAVVHALGAAHADPAHLQVAEEQLGLGPQGVRKLMYVEHEAAHRGGHDDQLNTAVTSYDGSWRGTVTDEDLDRHVAELILKEAKKKAERYASEGVRAYLPESSNVPRANKRFLSSIIRNTDEHNKTILRAQALAAQEIKEQREEQERRDRRARAEEAAEAERLRRGGAGSSRDHRRDRDRKRRDRSWERRDDDRYEYDRERRRRSQRRHRHEDDDRSHRHRSSRHKRDRSRSYSTERKEERRTRDYRKSYSSEDDEESSRRRRDRKRARSRSRSDSEDSWDSREKGRDRSRRYRSPEDDGKYRASSRKSRSAAGSRSSSREGYRSAPVLDHQDSLARHGSGVRDEHSTHSTHSPRLPTTDPDREAELRSKLKGKRKAEDNDFSDRESRYSSKSTGKGKARDKETLIEPSKKSTSRRSRPRSPSSSPPPVPPPPPIESKMDKYFEASYDPRLDVAPLKVPEIPATGLIDDAAFEGWDAMLRLIELRRQDKAEKKWLEKHGIKDSSKDKKGISTGVSERWDSGPSVMDIEYKKRGSVREWDLCKETPT